MTIGDRVELKADTTSVGTVTGERGGLLVVKWDTGFAERIAPAEVRKI